MPHKSQLTDQDRLRIVDLVDQGYGYRAIASRCGHTRSAMVVPAYNASETIAETLDAILAQTYGNWECIVVNDGSTDETESIARAYSARDSRVQVMSQENQGSGGAYNTGCTAARGEFITLCSADDILLEKCSAGNPRSEGSNPSPSAIYMLLPAEMGSVMGPFLLDFSIESAAKFG